MARKKYFDENNDEPCKGQHQAKQQDMKTLQPHNQQQACGFLVGGGTKNRKSHDYHAKNFDDSFGCVAKQLLNLGLTIREMPGDGNCLFRALSDQITGSSRNHLEYRRSVVQYMKEFRADFEPFVEDDEPFDIYTHRLSQAGTFAGNDAIVAFARLHNVTVVIHQLNSPAWIIHPSKDSQGHATGREVHIFYHNGDHYNSVRRIGDDSESPTNIKLHSQAASNKPSGKKSPPHSSSRTTNKTSTSTSESYTVTDYVVRDEDLWVKDTADLERLVDEIMQKTNYPDSNLVRDTLLEYNFDMNATMDFILSMSLVVHQREDVQKSDVEENVGDTPLIGDNGSRGQTSEAHIGTDEGNNILCNSKLLNDMDEQCEDVEDSEDSGMPDESDENSIAVSPKEDSSSQSKGINPTSRKLTPRHKKRERKRESDLRKKRSMGVGGTEKERESTENTVVISNLGSLDI